MSLQDIYYLLGIIFMVLGISILVAIGVVLWIIKQKVTTMHTMIETQVTRFTNNSGDMAMELGSKVANAAVRKVKDAITKKYTS